MKKNWISVMLLLILFISSFFALLVMTNKPAEYEKILASSTERKQNEYWFMLQRNLKKEFLFQGIPGNIAESTLVKVFNVNVGITGERPTPLPKLMGREYWNLISKFETTNDPETAPYFLKLDIPWPDVYPYGPSPYNECNGQCDWVRPGPFGLHGIAGNHSKLTDTGSSGCIRHTDEEITYLYNLLTPSEQNPIRYYIDDV